MPGVRTARRVWVSDHASCDRSACWPILSVQRYNDYLIVRVWRRLERIRCMLPVPMAGCLRLWGLVAGCFLWLVEIDYVVVGVVGIVL